MFVCFRSAKESVFQFLEHVHDYDVLRASLSGMPHTTRTCLGGLRKKPQRIMKDAQPSQVSRFKKVVVDRNSFEHNID
jgi:hypothetical protein